MTQSPRVILSKNKSIYEVYEKRINWSQIEDVRGDMMFFANDPKTFRTGINFDGDLTSEKENIGTWIDSLNPKRGLRSEIGDRRPIYDHGCVYFDNVDDYLRLSGVEFSSDMEIYASIKINSLVAGCLFGCSAFGYACPIVEGSDKAIYANPKPREFSINGHPAVNIHSLRESLLDHKRLVKVRLNMTTWPDLIIGHTDNVERFQGLKLYGLVLFDRKSAGRGLNRKEMNFLLEVLGLV